MSIVLVQELGRDDDGCLVTTLKAEQIDKLIGQLVCAKAEIENKNKQYKQLSKKKIMNEIRLNQSQLDYIVEQLAVRIMGLENGLMNTKEKARQLGIKPDTLRKLANKGKINAEKVGDEKQSRLLFTVEARIR